MPAAEAIETKCPRFLAIIPGKNSLTVCKWLIVLTLKFISIILGESSNRVFPETIPALLIRIVTVPNAVRAVLAAWWMESTSATSHLNMQIYAAGMPALMHRSLVSSRPGKFTSLSDK